MSAHRRPGGQIPFVALVGLVGGVVVVEVVVMVLAFERQLAWVLLLSDQVVDDEEADDLLLCPEDATVRLA